MYDAFPPVLEGGGIRIEPQAIRVWRNGQPVGLRLREFQTLLALATSPHRVWSRQEILAFCHASSGPRQPGSRHPDPRVVDVWVLALRRKLGPHIVETVRGVGYRWGDPVAVQPLVARGRLARRQQGGARA